MIFFKYSPMLALALVSQTAYGASLPILDSVATHWALTNRQSATVLNVPAYLCDDSNRCAINRLQAAHLFQAKEDWGRAADLYQDLINELPVIGDYLLWQQANCDIKGGSLERAQTAVERLNEQYPDSRFCKNHPELAPDLALARGDYQKAATLYSTAIEENPKSGQIIHLRMGLANSYLESGKKNLAAKEYQYIATHWPVSSEGKEAESQLNTLKLQQITPPNLTISEQKAFAKVLRRSGQNSRAATIYEKLLQKANPKSKEYLDLAPLLLDALLGADKYDEVAKWMATLPLDDFADQPYRYELETRLAKGQHNKAKQQQIFNRMVQKLPNSKAARTAILNRACDAHDEGNFELALTRFSGLFANGQNDAIAQDALWRTFLIHFEQNKLVEAMTELDRLGQIYQHDNSGQARIQYWKGRVFALQNKGQEAQDAYQYCEQLLPMGYYAIMTSLQLGELSAEPVKAALYDDQNSDNETNWCGLGKGHRQWGQIHFENNGELPLEIQRAQLFAILGLSQEVYTELGSLGSKGAQPDNLELTLAFEDYHHSFVWGKKALGLAASKYPTPTNINLFKAYFPLTYQPFIQKSAAENGIYDLLLQALMRQESAYKPFAHSWANARGLMQIIPKTGRRIAAAKGQDDYTDERLFEEPLSISYSGWYLAALLQKYHNQLPLAIGSYNAGPKAMSRWIDARSDLPMDLFIERIPYRETRNYVKFVLSGLHAYCTIYEPNSVIPWPEKANPQYGDNVNF